MPDKPYAVLSIPLLCLTAYLVTWIMVWMGIISKDAHGKFWNVLLLIALAGAAGLGFLLALQVNLKFNLPAAATFLVWHVDFGIGLLIIAIIHLSRHLKYYWSIIKPHAAKELKTFENQAQANSLKSEIDVEGKRTGRNYLLLLPFCLGLTTMASQIILLREFLSVFNGNELVIGVVLANWMLLTGLGAWSGKYIRNGNDRIDRIAPMLLVLAMMAPFTLFALDGLRNILFTTGSMVGLFRIFITSLALLAPFCVLSGFLFTYLSRLLSSRSNENLTGKVYSWESIGSVAGGALFNLVLVFFLRPFRAFSIIIIINALILALLLYRFRKKSLVAVFILATTIFITLVMLVNPDHLTRKLLFPGQEILAYKDTPLGNIVITESGGQKNLYENNSLIYTTNNIISNEESVHYAMLQRENPANILLVGNGFSAVIDEILKYPIHRLDYLEMNPWLQKTTGSILGMSKDEKLHIVIGDPAIFIREAKDQLAQNIQGKASALKYDAILLNLPDPYTIQLNRFYSIEFLETLKPLLNDRGVVSLSLISTADFMGYSSARLHSVIYSTLKCVFKDVMIVPGDRDYFLASDSTLRLDFAALQVERGIETEYVNSFYLDDHSLLQRNKSIMQGIPKGGSVNHDFEPVAFRSQIKYWLDYFGGSGRFLPLILLLLLFPLIFRMDGVSIGMFSAGFAASASEIIIMMAFQVIYGYVFLAAGMIITVFMLGLALGSAFGRKYFPNPTYNLLVKMEVALAICMLVEIAAIYFFHREQTAAAAIYAGFGLMTLIIAMLTGLIFQAASIIKQGNVQTIAGSLYSADLLGSAVGALIVSTVIIPSFGLFKALIIVGAFCLLSAIIMLIKRRMT